MKKQVLLFSTLLLLLLTGFQSLNAQEATIKSRLGDYIEATNTGNWDKVLDMVYDKLFETVPKEQMKQMFSQMGAMGLKMEVKEYTIANMSEKMSEEGTDFVIVEYNADENLTLSGPQFSNDAVIQQMQAQFKTLYGEDNVTYDKESNSFALQGTKIMVAAAKSGSEEWKFIEYNVTNPMQAQMLEQIIPANVISKLKEKK
jgi:hypothetical protein